eukprot:CAMPEP_0173260058 /NCGR_PEP_ID=MMETSP1142-20121109/25356_1 /TAXON_ID=483371 /ORGANISM="non described non described, Strain CCMP2298" /LENGTH=136 /DNA_ID=CAMNT_0014194739 /DNA_START=141 /DNA_END=551 /DNA_ORIENTATION=+
MLNEYGKKFERVNRLHCKGTTFDVDFVVDVNSELFDAKAGDRVGVVLASSLNGEADDGTFKPTYGPHSLADSYEYVMHGRVFNIKHIERQCVEVQASFGGLLCRLRGEQAHMESLVLDMTFFLLMRRGGSAGAMDI